MKKLILTTLVGLLLLMTITSAQTIIVDDSDGAPWYTETGIIWNSYSHVCGYGGTYRYETDGTTEYAAWLPNITEAGNYEVFVHWCVHSARPTAVPYKVVYNGGTNTVNVDQTKDAFGGTVPNFRASGWKSLGIYNFVAGMSGYVELDTSSSGDTCADAVMFLRSPDRYVAIDCTSKPTPCDTTIQTAINSASPGNLIYVYPGTYSESVTVNQAVTIIGSGSSSTTIVDATGYSYGFSITANDVTVKDLIVQGATDFGFILTNTDGVTIENNVIRNLPGSGVNGHGIFLPSDVSGSNTNTLIKNNEIYNFAGCGVITWPTPTLFYGYDGLSIISNKIHQVGLRGINIQRATGTIRILNNEIIGTAPSISAQNPSVEGIDVNTGNGATLHIIKNTINNFPYVGTFLGRAAVATTSSPIISFKYNTLSDNYYGLQTKGRGVGNGLVNLEVRRNTIKDSTGQPGSYGIKLENVSAKVTYNDVYRSAYIGIIILGDSSTISHNEIKENGKGIWVDGDYNIITNNIIEDNTLYTTGVHLTSDAEHNKIYYNKFIDNEPQAWDDGSDNEWDDGKKGNYWSDLRSNLGYPLNYLINGSAESMDNHPSGARLYVRVSAKNGKIEKLQEFSSENFTYNRTKASVSLNFRDGRLRTWAFLRIKTRTSDNKKVYASVRFKPDAIYKISKNDIHVEGSGEIIKRITGRRYRFYDREYLDSISIHVTNAKTMNITGSKAGDEIFRLTGMTVTRFFYREI